MLYVRDSLLIAPGAAEDIPRLCLPTLEELELGTSSHRISFPSPQAKMLTSYPPRYMDSFPVFSIPA